MERSRLTQVLCHLMKRQRFKAWAKNEWQVRTERRRGKSLFTDQSAKDEPLQAEVACRSQVEVARGLPYEDGSQQGSLTTGTICG